MDMRDTSMKVSNEEIYFHFFFFSQLKYFARKGRDHDKLGFLLMLDRERKFLFEPFSALNFEEEKYSIENS